MLNAVVRKSQSILTSNRFTYPVIIRSLGNAVNSMNVFNRKAKRIQRDRASLKEDSHVYDYLKEEVGYRLADRVFDIKRNFDVAVDLGCGRGYLAEHLDKEAVQALFHCEMAQHPLQRSKLSNQFPVFKVQMDEEFIPFRENILDIVISCLSLHWVNNLPGTFLQVNRALKQDGVFMASVFGGDTLFQLRCSLQLAELEREGGFAPHISPFAEVKDIGGLLNQAGFTMTTLDTDEIVVNYPSMFELMTDLKGMGENNASLSRSKLLHRDSMIAAAAIYKDLYGNEDGSIPATFQIVNFIAWKPDPTQAKPAKRGSANVSLKDLGKFNEIAEEFKKKDS